VDVTPGRRIGDNLEITGTLKSGDKVVLAPPEKLASGMKITVAAK